MPLLESITEYENFIYGLPNQYPQILYSTLVLKRFGPHVGEVSGTIFFEKDVKLNVKELLDFRQKRIRTYSYEVYLGRNRQYWYDDQPHPDDPSLQSTHPHHKHIPPDIKHHRIPAPHIHFDQSNLPFLIQEILEAFLSE
jgi:hypothetical protein